jgi:hypothetical protein
MTETKELLAVLAACKEHLPGLRWSSIIYEGVRPCVLGSSSVFSVLVFTGGTVRILLEFRKVETACDISYKGHSPKVLARNLKRDISSTALSLITAVVGS